MGGNAFSRVGKVSERFDRKTYDMLLDTLVHEFKSHGFSYREIKFFKNKDSFGDIDIIVESTSMNEHLIKYLTKHYCEIVPHKNGNVVSLLFFDKYQVDIIFTEFDMMDIAQAYFSWNDLGNFLGRIAHSYGLKFGHNGLFAIIRGDDNSSNQLGKVTLSTNIKDIFNYFGWDHYRWQKGFDTIEDIFKFVISCKHFQGKSYKYDELNHINRTRNKKRAVYAQFITYLEDNGLIESFNSQNKGHNVTHALISFDKMDEYENILSTIERRIQVREKFNGEIVNLHTKLTGPKLGRFIASYKKQYAHFDEFILKQSPTEIETTIKKHLSLNFS